MNHLHEALIQLLPWYGYITLGLMHHRRSALVVSHHHTERLTDLDSVKVDLLHPSTDAACLRPTMEPRCYDCSAVGPSGAFHQIMQELVLRRRPVSMAGQTQGDLANNGCGSERELGFIPAGKPPVACE